MSIHYRALMSDILMCVGGFLTGSMLVLPADHAHGLMMALSLMMMAVGVSVHAYDTNKLVSTKRRR